MTERLIVPVLKTGGLKGSVGSNPTSSSNASLAQLVEQWSPKPEVSGPTPEGCADVSLINEGNNL